MNNHKRITDQIKKLSPWFHNIHLPGGFQTAPNHLLGDFPSFKWKEITPHLPEDMTGLEVLDIGCNAGFYSIECARRGAKVTSIDVDPLYLRQAGWVAEEFGVSHLITFQHMQVYDLLKIEKQFDIILFLGVFYHLRYPMLAVDIVTEKAKDIIVFQSLSLQVEEEAEPAEDFGFEKRDIMLQKGWPSMAFIEGFFQGDPTNWWVPNPAAIKAIFRTAGFKNTLSPGEEIYIFQPDKSLTPVSRDWNRSEFLSATGQQWQEKVKDKTTTKNTLWTT